MKFEPSPEDNTSQDESLDKSKYLDALSREMSEGGYTFFHRVFREHFATHEPVVINTGKMYLSYTYKAGDETMLDGITVLEGEDETETWSAVQSVAGAFDINMAFTENKIEKPI